MMQKVAASHLPDLEKRSVPVLDGEGHVALCKPGIRHQRALFPIYNYLCTRSAAMMSCRRVGAKERMSQRRTHVDSGAFGQVEVERLASRDGERVDDHGRALDGVVDVVQGGNGSGAVAGGGRSNNSASQRE